MSWVVPSIPRLDRWVCSSCHLARGNEYWDYQSKTQSHEELPVSVAVI